MDFCWSVGRFLLIVWRMSGGFAGGLLVFFCLWMFVGFRFVFLVDRVWICLMIVDGLMVDCLWISAGCLMDFLWFVGGFVCGCLMDCMLVLLLILDGVFGFLLECWWIFYGLLMDLSGCQMDRWWV